MAGPLDAAPFERPPAGVRDPDASYLDLPFAHPHGLVVRRGEPLADQVDQYFWAVGVALVLAFMCNACSEAKYAHCVVFGIGHGARLVREPR
jgi:hypothetical protein